MLYSPSSNELFSTIPPKEAKYETLLAAKDQIQTILSNQSDTEKYDMTNAITEEKEYNGKEKYKRE